MISTAAIGMALWVWMVVTRLEAMYLP